MKKIKGNKKFLSLNKSTVSNLSLNELKEVVGGWDKCSRYNFHDTCLSGGGSCWPTYGEIL